MQRLVTASTLKTQLAQYNKLLSNFNNIQQLPQLLENYNHILDDFNQHINQRLAEGETSSWLERLLKYFFIKKTMRLLAAINKILLRCIQQLPHVDASKIPRSELEKKLRQKIQLSELPAILQKISFVTISIFSTYVQSQEDFLEAVNLRLKNVYDFLADASVHERSKQEATQELSTTIHDQINQLSDELVKTDKLDSLRDVVTNRLETIGAALDSYQVKENNRCESMLKTIIVMQQKLQAQEQSQQELKTALTEAIDNARLDGLTGLFNRRAFDEYLLESIQDHQQNQTPYALILGDIDYFKQLNDNHGHLAGDIVLRIVANLCRDHMRDSDFIARFGGEEIVFVLRGDLDNANQAADKLRQIIENWKFPHQDQLLQATMSFGVTTLNERDTKDSVFARVDDCLYQAKQSGRNKVVTTPYSA